MTAPPVIAPQRSGVYRSPAEAPSLLARVAAAGGRGTSADLARVRSKAMLMETLAAALALPATFGANWDALADSLQDLPSAAQGRVLHLRNAAAARQALGGDWPTFLEILQDAAVYWSTHGTAFVVFVDDASALPVWT